MKRLSKKSPTKELLLSGVLCAGLSLEAAEPLALSQNCEIALALSAAPAHLWAGAGVWILGEQGYRRVQESENGFHCLVERNHEHSIIPICYDRSARSAHLALALDKAERWRAGASFAEVESWAAREVSAGAYGEAGPGVTYMISAFNRIYDSEQDVLLQVAPHLMYHAPSLDAEAIGADPSAAFSNLGLPLINNPGPHGFVFHFVTDSSDSRRVERDCGNELQTERPLRAFPPASP